MTRDPFHFQPLPGSGFGVQVTIDPAVTGDPLEALVANAARLNEKLSDAGGLLVVHGLSAITENPEALVSLSRAFGPEVEDYHQTLTASRFLHDTVRELIVLSNEPPCRHPPPPRPDPPFNADGSLVTGFPEQTNWHTDQSYRRPPPDVTLLFGAVTPPRDEGQTLFADCTAAYAALEADVRDRLKGLSGIHAPGWIGRTADDVRAGRPPKQVLPHQLPQRQPLVRSHPVTGKPALYICEDRQMDFVDGPIAGLEPGPDGEGARLLRSLLAHATSKPFVHVHEWQPGDLVIADNRCLLHAATWYDADRHARLMWRTTVRGNAGSEYAGEAKSWLPPEGLQVMQGMEDA